ncbi:SAC3/GANP family protein [Gregarina niphandrodes]|uniref:SAC3/GANP family protein n=1 Tax=Gregarina niphandrodes TaxID=110365 RepID=A0A023B6B6_GRENI|nr:SAC3/GANP family protein [Gregarina niphandrodes]EZG66173.1 SAC3/GANP family protein [Gregarina niphandrodes]|eukprot:XP_011134014.1 SAC3/GANP family protein [Gregarina niphandrodes]
MDLQNIINSRPPNGLYQKTNTTTLTQALKDIKLKTVIAVATDEHAAVTLKQVLEESVLLAISVGDEEQFKKDYDQLEKLYFSRNVRSRLTFNETECLLLGIGLMRNLRDNDIPSFHVLLQEIRYLVEKVKGTSDMAKSLAQGWQYLEFPLDIEKEIANGNMSRVLELAERKVPHDAYLPFTRALILTIRTHVCTALESAYQKNQVV